MLKNPLTPYHVVLPGGVLDEQNLAVQEGHVGRGVDFGPRAGEQQSRLAHSELQQHRGDHGRDNARRRSR